MKNVDLILRGDLNFSLGMEKYWIQRAKLNSLLELYNHFLAEKGLIDMGPIRLYPTWRKKRMGEACIDKRLDCCLISLKLSETTLLFRQWIRSGRE